MVGLHDDVIGAQPGAPGHLLAQVVDAQAQRLVGDEEPDVRGVDEDEAVVGLVRDGDRASLEAREAIRSNMGDVFRAISQRNPYAAEYFDDIAWNQMVAKCVFTDLPLRSIHGLDARANEALARMLLDLAQERRAAGRPLSPEAWRCIVPFSAFEREGEALLFLADMLAHGGTGARAAALALHKAPTPAGRLLLKAAAPELLTLVEAGTLTWDNYDV